MSKAKDKEFISEVKRVLGLRTNCPDTDVFVEIGRLKAEKEPFPNLIGTGTGLPVYYNGDDTSLNN